jgi:type VI secretion system secreted protein VgrG
LGTKIKSGAKCVRHRGTEEGAAGKKDWLNNFLQGTGQKAPQYTQAIRTAQKFSEATGGMNISFTGHSLGGGLAMAQALVTGTQATVFNAAAVYIETIKPYGVNFSNADQLIKAYNV